MSLLHPVTDATTNNANVLALLNRCIRACVDAEKGYAIASADAGDPVLRALFHVYQRQRADFVEALQTTAERIAAAPINEGTARGALHRNWLDARLAFEGRDDAIILDEVARGEAAAARVYRTALQCADCVSAEVRAMLVWQDEAIRSALEDVRSRSMLPRHPAR